MTIERPIRYRVTLETLTPLHIGVGKDLLFEYDFTVHGGKTWIVDREVLAEYLIHDKTAFQRMINREPLSRLIDSSAYRDESQLFRYVIAGEPITTTPGSRIRLQMKDAWDQPYIPGSSLKGALRTAILNRAYQELGMDLSVDDLPRNPKDAARKTEQRIISPDLRSTESAPNFDVFRVLQVSDSTSVPISRLGLYSAAVFSKGAVGVPIPLEAIRAGTQLQTVITFDRVLIERENYFTPLRWRPNTQLTWVQSIRDSVNAFTGSRVQQEQSYWRERGSAKLETVRETLKFYHRLTSVYEEVRQSENDCLLQLGWGGGWTSKTFNHHLTADMDKFYTIVRKYDQMNFKEGYQRGQPFPKSRRVDAKEEKTLRPFGWVKMTMERES